MTLKEFNTTKFTSKTKVLYECRRYKVARVTFDYKQVGIAKEGWEGIYIQWINYTEFSIVKTK